MSKKIQTTRKIAFLLCALIFFSIVLIIIFKPIFKTDEVIINSGLRSFNICKENPLLWKYIKIVYVVTFYFSCLIISNRLFNIINKITKSNKVHHNYNQKNASNELKLLIGYDEEKEQDVYIPESGLYQNFLITGTIGTGKTSSAMYPLTKQLIEYNNNNHNNKIGMLILDVKGNYYKQVKKYVYTYKLQKDLIVLELHSKIKYNPLHKPRIKSTSISK